MPVLFLLPLLWEKVARTKSAPDEGSLSAETDPSPVRDATHRGHPLPQGARGSKSRAYTPPILQTIFHSSAVTGCTDSREYFTSAMSASRLSALIAAIVTGVFRGLSALMSTQTNLPVLSVGSGKPSLLIS